MQHASVPEGHSRCIRPLWIAPFSSRNPRSVARDLLGKSAGSPRRTLRVSLARIVEVEAYLGKLTIQPPTPPPATRHATPCSSDHPATPTFTSSTAITIA